MIGAFIKKVAPLAAAKPYSIRHDGWIHLLEARRGRGKSYAMAQWALAGIMAGKHVYANFSLDHHAFAYRLMKARKFVKLQDAIDYCNQHIHYADTWDKVLIAYDAVVLLDECNRIFDVTYTGKDSRAPNVVFEFIQQCRKHKITMVLAAQSMDWLTPRIRQICDILWRTKRVDDKKGNPVVFNIYGCDPFANGLSAEVVRDADYKMFVPFKLENTRLYSSFEVIKAIAPISNFETFKEIERYMLDHGLKPASRGRRDWVYPAWWSAGVLRDALTELIDRRLEVARGARRHDAAPLASD